MRTILSVFLAGMGLLLSVAPLSAHHSIAAVFDVDRTISLRGTVTKIEWMNPHTYIFMDVKDKATGKVTTWVFETGSSKVLANQGWTRTSMKVGLELVVDGAQARDGSKVVHIRTIAQLPSY
jgi:hypothetical protein